MTRERLLQDIGCEGSKARQLDPPRNVQDVIDEAEKHLEARVEVGRACAWRESSGDFDQRELSAHCMESARAQRLAASR